MQTDILLRVWGLQTRAVGKIRHASRDRHEAVEKIVIPYCLSRHLPVITAEQNVIIYSSVPCISLSKESPMSLTVLSQPQSHPVLSKTGKTPLYRPPGSPGVKTGISTGSMLADGHGKEQP